MTEVLGALALVMCGAWLTRSVYQFGMTAGVRLGYGMGHNDATAAARRLVAERIEQLGSEANGQ
jgi:hypothetical protein